MAKYRFGQRDIFYARAKVHPRNEFWVTSSNIYYNGDQKFSASLYPGNLGSAGGTVKHLGAANDLNSGSISLYEMNIDKPVSGSKDGAFDYGFAYAFLPKTSDLETFKTITTASVEASVDVLMNSQYGDKIEKLYPLSSSISINFFSESSGFSTTDPNAITANYSSSIGREIEALRNTLNFYTKNSPHYAYSSSYLGWEKAKQAMCMIGVPSIFYGSSIDKGTIDLKFYISGTLIGQLRDEKRNGELIQVAPVGSNGSGSVAGVALYGEGFLILTGNWDLSNGATIGPFLGGGSDGAVGSTDWIGPRWQYFGLLGSTGSLNGTASYHMSFDGTNHIPNITMHARAPKGRLNYSNNPTFLSYNQPSGTFTTASSTTTSSVSFIQSPNIEIASINSSSYSSHSSSFKSTTYLSKIGIYDEDHNLIAVAKMATPVRKREEDDLTFRLKLDI